jgi:hypothetical protein
MKKSRIIVLIIIFLCSCKENTDLIVKRRIADLTSIGTSAIVYVKHDNYELENVSGSENDEIMVGELISSALDQRGIKINFDENASLLKVECHFLHGWGLPRLNRHFRISFKYITFINIKIINTTTNEVIGEVEYKKPFFQSDQKDIITTLIGHLFVSL